MVDKDPQSQCGTTRPSIVSRIGCRATRGKWRSPKPTTFDATRLFLSLGRVPTCVMHRHISFGARLDLSLHREWVACWHMASRDPRAIVARSDLTPSMGGRKVTHGYKDLYINLWCAVQSLPWPWLSQGSQIGRGFVWKPCHIIPTFLLKALHKQEVSGGICRACLLPLQHARLLSLSKHMKTTMTRCISIDKR
jgi:hypothetical protein